MKHRVIILVLLLLAVGVTSIYAGSSRRIGTAGATELVIPVGARGSALGGSAVATITGVEAIYWNPAGLAALEGTEALFSHQPYLADIKVEYAGIATTIEGFGTIGASAKIVSAGDVEETTEEFPEGTGNVYNPTLAVIGLSYARILTANVSMGVNAMLIQENIFEVKATGVAFDVGFVYDPRWQGLTLGLAIKNYGPNMKFSGEGFQRRFNEAGTRQVSPNNAGFELPSSINLGVAYNFLRGTNSSMTLSGNFRSNNFSEDMYQGGLEFGYDGKYFLRGGYNFADQDVDLDNSNDYLYGVTLGAGLSVPIGESKLTFDYSWTETDVFDDNQFFTLKASF